MNLLLQPFTLGTSTVITLPKKLGITPHQKVRATKKGLTVILKPVSSKKDQKMRDVQLVEKLSGGLNFSSQLTPSEMNKIYDQEVYGD